MLGGGGGILGRETTPVSPGRTGVECPISGMARGLEEQGRAQEAEVHDCVHVCVQGGIIPGRETSTASDRGGRASDRGQTVARAFLGVGCVQRRWVGGSTPPPPHFCTETCQL